jgi:predicted enzyme related to lactoylglutathione lyase
MIRENQEVPSMGAFSIFTDAQGAVLAIWQPNVGNCDVTDRSA